MTFKLVYDMLARLLLSPTFWTVMVVVSWQILLKFLNAIYEAYLNYFNAPEEVFFGTLPYIYVGVIAILATVISILVSSAVSRQNQRRQNTVKILLESRLSHNYGVLGELDRSYFSKIDDGTAKTYRTYRTDLGGSGKKREGAKAVLQMLNYFEFLSAGILYRNFDETMMEKSIRGILCLRVYNMRYIIQEIRKKRPKSYEHLVALYWLWFDEETDKKLPNRVNLGSSPPAWLMKLHRIVFKFPPIL